jgi:hypothetical protein
MSPEIAHPFIDFVGTITLVILTIIILLLGALLLVTTMRRYLPQLVWGAPRYRTQMHQLKKPMSPPGALAEYEVKELRGFYHQSKSGQWFIGAAHLTKWED